MTYDEHIQQIAKKRLVEILPRLCETSTAYRDIRSKYIRTVTPVITDAQYSTALHELGHLIHPWGYVWPPSRRSISMRMFNIPQTADDVRLTLQSERNAWAWARKNAMQWTPLMEEDAQDAFETYRSWAERHTLSEGGFINLSPLDYTETEPGWVEKVLTKINEVFWIGQGAKMANRFRFNSRSCGACALVAGIIIPFVCKIFRGR